MWNTSETYLALDIRLEAVQPTAVTWLEGEERLQIWSARRDQSIKLVLVDDERMEYPIGHFRLLASTGT